MEACYLARRFLGPLPAPIRVEEPDPLAYEWNFGPALASFPQLAVGAIFTLNLVVSSLCLAIPIGVLMGIVRYQRIPVLSALAVVYIDVFRSSVMLVLICWCYYALPILIGINLSTFTACTLAVGLQMSAFMAEIVRGGIQSIERGQWEAARALGMSPPESLRYIVLPQAFQRMLPVFFLLLIELIKTTALAGVVTYPEMFYQASEIASRTYRPIETFTVVGAIYFVVIFTLSRASQFMQRRYAANSGR